MFVLGGLSFKMEEEGQLLAAPGFCRPERIYLPPCAVLNGQEGIRLLFQGVEVEKVEDAFVQAPT